MPKNGCKSIQNHQTNLFLFSFTFSFLGCGHSTPTCHNVRFRLLSVFTLKNNLTHNNRFSYQKVVIFYIYIVIYESKMVRSKWISPIKNKTESHPTKIQKLQACIRWYAASDSQVAKHPPVLSIECTIFHRKSREII